jgi:hypothetical protein
LTETFLLNKMQYGKKYRFYIVSTEFSEFVTEIELFLGHFLAKRYIILVFSPYLLYNITTKGDLRVWSLNMKLLRQDPGICGPMGFLNLINSFILVIHVTLLISFIACNATFMVNINVISVSL